MNTQRFFQAELKLIKVGFGSLFAAHRKILGVRYVPLSAYSFFNLNGSYLEAFNQRCFGRLHSQPITDFQP